ncbi:putative glycoside hydrolase [Candidatus Latescibacterota bacterium]
MIERALKTSLAAVLVLGGVIGGVGAEVPSNSSVALSPLTGAAGASQLQGQVAVVTGTRADSAVVVQPGESLSSIAHRLLTSSDSYTTGQLVHRIRAANSLSGDRVLAGQTLRVPLAGEGTPDRAASSPADQSVDARGLYLTARLAGAAAGLELADSLVAAGGNTVVFDIKDRPGDLSYVSGAPMAVATQVCSLATIGRPRALVDQLHQRGLYVVARLACFHDSRLASARPDLVPLSRRGEGLWRERGVLAWVDPSLPEVQDYLLDVVREVAGFGIDEIQLDYVRFPTDGDVGDAVFAFDPEVVPKHEVITSFVGRVRRALAGSGIQLSADIFGVAAWGRDEDVRAIGQYLPDLLPLLDVVSPMLYPSHFSGNFQQVETPWEYPYEIVSEGCRRLLPLAGDHGVVIRPWVQAFPYRVQDFDAGYVMDQVRGAEDGGARGWLLWNPKSQYSVGLSAMRQLSSRAPSP